MGYKYETEYCSQLKLWKNENMPLLSAFTLFQLNVSAGVKTRDIEWILKWKIKDITEELFFFEGYE